MKFFDRKEKYNKFLFVHIPKTGGTSILSILNDQWNRSYPMNHDPLFNLELLNNITNDVFRFCIVRNPYTRTFSYYKHFLLQNPEYKDWNFETFLYHIKKKIYFSNTPMILYPQSFYVYDLNGEVSINIFNFEKINKLEKILKRKIPHLYKGNYTKDEYYNAYTAKNIETVGQIFSIDFTNFNYSKKFK